MINLAICWWAILVIVVLIIIVIVFLVCLDLIKYFIDSGIKWKEIIGYGLMAIMVLLALTLLYIGISQAIC